MKAWYVSVYSPYRCLKFICWSEVWQKKQKQNEYVRDKYFSFIVLFTILFYYVVWIIRSSTNNVFNLLYNNHWVRDQIEFVLLSKTWLTFSKHQSSRLMLELCLGIPLWTSHFHQPAEPRAIISLNSHRNIRDAAAHTDPSTHKISNWLRTGNIV